METEIIDKLFLELSQFTQARTGREILLQAAVNAAERYIHARETRAPTSEVQRLYLDLQHAIVGTQR